MNPAFANRAVWLASFLRDPLSSSFQCWDHLPDIYLDTGDLGVAPCLCSTAGTLTLRLQCSVWYVRVDLLL